jgi:hypothetical protein
VEPQVVLGAAGERWMRLDSATVLKRYHLLEAELARACAAWIPALRRLESKAAMARLAWQSVLAARALRERVLELRYPSRLIEVGADAPLVALFRALVNAPGAGAVARAVAEVLCPALASAYRDYLEASDEVADGPSLRTVDLALREKEEQVRAMSAVAEVEAEAGSSSWVGEVARLLAHLGGVGLRPPRPTDVPAVLGGGRCFRLAQDPARDDRYLCCRFYWPDVVDPGYPYGEGLRLQIRTAVSHLNEVWAVETAAALLHGLPEELGWEFMPDGARWLYDEARHMAMGRRRLETWGLPAAEVPLGTYIYRACRDQDLVYRLGMLAYFETRNIGKKRERVRSFQRLGDAASQRDMDFDWADETIHADYGRRWLTRLLQVRGWEQSWRTVLDRCQELVAAEVASATPVEREEIRKAAERLIARATAMARAR